MRPKQFFLALVMIVLYGPLFAQSITPPNEEIATTLQQIQTTELTKWYKAMGVISWDYLATTALFFKIESAETEQLARLPETTRQVKSMTSKDSIDRGDRRRKVVRRTRCCYVWSDGTTTFLPPPPPPQQHHRNH